MEGNEKYHVVAMDSSECRTLSPRGPRVCARYICVKEKKNYAIGDIVHMWQEPLTPVD